MSQLTQTDAKREAALDLSDAIESLYAAALDLAIARNRDLSDRAAKIAELASALRSELESA